jgi:hypothetical protein
MDDTAFRYDVPSSTNGLSGLTTNFSTFKFNTSWGQLVVFVEGAPANSNVLSAEHILLSEMIPKKSAFIMGTAAAPNSPGVMSAVSSMQGDTDFAHNEAQQDGYISQSLDALRRGAAQQGQTVYDNVAVPLMNAMGRRAGNAAMNYAMNMVSGVGGIPGVNANPLRLALE